jgi:predicted transcriptional regulator
MIAHSSTTTSDILISKPKITRKQCYSRLSALTKAGLLQRKSGRYSPTSLGKIIHDVQLSLEKAVSNYWNLKGYIQCQDHSLLSLIIPFHPDC